MPTSSHHPPRLLIDLLFYICLALLCPQANAQDYAACRSDRGAETVWRIGDNPAWAHPAHCESGWDRFSTFTAAPSGVFWIRSFINLAPQSDHDGAVLAVNATGAYEVYFDGVLLGGSGVVSDMIAGETPGRLRTRFGVPRDFLSAGNHVIAVRISANYLRNPSNFRITYNLASRTEQHNRDAVNMLTLGAALAAVMLLFVFYWAGARNPIAHIRFLAPLGLAVSIAALASLETAKSAGLILYPSAFVANGLAVAATLMAAAALPAFYLTRVDTARTRAWASGAIIAAAIATPVWPFTPLEHDARLFTALCVYCLILISIVKPTSTRDRRFLLAGPALCIIAILADPQALYLFLAALSVVLAADFTRSMRDQEKKMQQAEIAASRFESELLRRNLQPHFIMNSLTAVAEWIETAPRDALQFIYGLAEEFRALNNLANKRLTPIRDEIELCKTHLQLMSLRLRKAFQLNVRGIGGDEEVPPAIFLTLLENALSHNRYGPDGAAFSLSADHTSRYILFRFASPLRESTSHAASSTQMGLQYIRARLEESFPGAWSLSSISDGDEWVTEIKISNE